MRESWLPSVNLGCVHNEMHALVKRALGACAPELDPTPAGIASFVRAAGRITGALKKLIGEQLPMEMDDIVKGYSGRKRRVYEDALAEIKRNGYDKRDLQVRSFVKLEKAKFEAKDPRLIQARKPGGNLRFMQFTKPLEKGFYGLKSSKAWGVKGTRLIAKGLTQGGRAREICKKISQFSDPIVVSLDASRFDKHVRAYMLRCMHKLYRKLCWRSDIEAVLAKQLSVKGRTKGGIKYTFGPRRITGDADTALSNCAIMLAACHSVMEGRKHDLFVDGDDALIFMERHLWESEYKNTLVERFSNLGFKVSIGSVHREAEGISHCHSRLVYTAKGPVMVRDWDRVVSHAFSSTRHFLNKVGGMKVFRLMGCCELCLGEGVPILDTLGRSILRFTRGSKLPKGLLHEMAMGRRALLEMREQSIFDIESKPAIPVTLAARESFARAFGVPISRQWEIEARLTTMRPAFEFPPVRPPEHLYGREWIDWENLNRPY